MLCQIAPRTLSVKTDVR